MWIHPKYDYAKWDSSSVAYCGNKKYNLLAERVVMKMK